MKGQPVRRYLPNEYWYGDDPPRLKASFSAKTAERQAEVVDLLERAATKNPADSFFV